MTADQNQIQPNSEIVPQQPVVENTIPEDLKVEVSAAAPEVNSAEVSETPESAAAGTEIISDQAIASAQAIVQDQNQVSAPVQDVVSDDVTVPQTTESSLVVDDTAEFPGDEVYLREVNRVIKEDAEDPFQEEEDSEMIQKDYLSKRFGVSVDKDKE